MKGQNISKSSIIEIYSILGWLKIHYNLRINFNLSWIFSLIKRETFTTTDLFINVHKMLTLHIIHVIPLYWPFEEVVPYMAGNVVEVQFFNYCLYRIYTELSIHDPEWYENHITFSKSYSLSKDDLPVLHSYIAGWTS